MKLFVMLALVLSVFTLSQVADAQHYPRPRPGHPGHGGHPGAGYQRDYIRCESHNYNYSECSSWRVRRIERARLVRQYSKTNCYAGHNYGVRFGNLWVSNGCRGEFEVSGWGR